MADVPRFGERIKEIREMRGLSKRQAARRSDGAFSANGLYRIEASENPLRGDEKRAPTTRDNPKVTTLIGLCKALDMRIVIDPEGLFIDPVEEDK